MEHPGFFLKAGPFSLSEIAAISEAELAEGADGAMMISDVRPLNLAGPEDISFVDNKKYFEQLDTTKAVACFISPKFVDRMPEGTAAIIAPEPYRSFAKALTLFYPDANWSKGAGYGTDDFAGHIHATAQIEDNVVIEPGAVIGCEVHIGRGSRICSGAVIGYRSMIGRMSYIGPGASVTHSLIGNNVIIHAGVRLGQDGFGFAMGPQGHLKVPQIGRVIIQDDVEIGANSCVDRGTLNDTIVGEGTKIDDLVMIGHNVVIGRHCVLVSQSGVAGSATLGDFVVMGGRVAIIGHVKIGDGAQIGGWSWVKDDVPAGARLAGTPARPFREWARALAGIRKLGQKAPPKPGGKDRKGKS